MRITLTDIPGIMVGHANAFNTGCTVILCAHGMVAGVAVPGMAPGSRELELLRPVNVVSEVHGICLCGGSAFGLAAASGVMRYLAEQGHGFSVPVHKVPIVPAAVVFDFFRNQKPGILPDESMGHLAAATASSQAVANGPLGAGAGTACGMMAGRLHPTGLGSYGVKYKDIIVAALVVNNAMGNIHHPQSGKFLAGAQNERGHALSHEELFDILQYAPQPQLPGNTLLAVVATNAALDKLECNRMAAIASQGIAWAVRPSNLLMDGDIVFSLASKKGPKANLNLLGVMAAHSLSMAVVASVENKE